MNKLQIPGLRLLVAAAFLVICPVTLIATDEPALTKEQIRHFLLTAKVVNSHESKKGITHTSRLTLSDGTLMHDASFQPVNEHKAVKQISDGQTEINFVDSYKYNLAAYALAELVGFDDMMPVYVERNWKGHTGSLSWWLHVKMDDAERVTRKLEPPDKEVWNNQMYKIRVFDELVQDTDPNLTNILIGEDWKLWRIDYTRAFRALPGVKHPSDLVHCERQMLEKLKALNVSQLTEKTKSNLTSAEIKGVMARRDAIVQHFQKLIADQGENEVLY
jgi:hypothetical protein